MVAPYLNFLDSFHTIEGIEVNLFNERLITPSLMDLLSTSKLLRLPLPLTRKDKTELILSNPRFLSKLSEAPLLAKESMIFIARGNKKQDQEEDLQIPPSAFEHLHSLERAVAKYDE